MIVRRVLSEWLRSIDARLDQNFYLRQLNGSGSHARAERDPSLHYALVGQFRSYSPYPEFDPVFYRAQNPDLGWGRDPLEHYARAGNESLSTHEMAALASL
ncbi:MAG: hypothetical protein ACRD3W_19690, partial [Terriglobales bacterium]